MMAVAYTSNNFAQVVRLGSCSLRDIGKRIEEKGTKDSTDEKGLFLCSSESQVFGICSATLFGTKCMY